MWMVGIGSSGGGIEALRELLPELPGGDVAYVLAQHLSPTHPSMLLDILARETELEVVTAKNRMVVKPGTIYVIPPNRDVQVSDGKLVSKVAKTRISPQPSVDVLLTSLAEEAGTRAVGIVLSGTGKDGVLGTQAIKHAGGTVLVQDPLGARYVSMPAAVLDSSNPDFVGDVSEIAKALSSLVLRGALPEAHDRFGRDAGMAALASECRRVFGWDMANYKDGTLRRQLRRRMKDLGISSKDKYVEFALASPEELKIYRESVLVCVTSFFRDTEAWDVFQTQLVETLAQKEDGSTFRAWVAGCATGEEAYSLGICVLEALDSLEKNLTVKIFATDISADSVASTRAATYTTDALKSVRPELRTRYFTGEASVTTVTKTLRDSVIVAQHDIARDPPLVRMDVVLCRNLLIYLVPEVQARVFESIAASLEDDGLLMLGRSEAPPADTKLFSVKDSVNRIYGKVPGISPRLRPQIPAARDFGKTATVSPTLPAVRRDAIRDAIRDSLLAHFGPPTVVIDRNYRPLHVVGDVSQYFERELVEGNVSLDTLLVPELRAEALLLLSGLERGLESPRSGPILLRSSEQKSDAAAVQLEAHRFLLPAAEDARYFLSIVPMRDSFAAQEKGKETPPPGALGAEQAPAMLQQRLEASERELRATREHLTSVIEELEASNEELQSMNEEVQASSEELQATNEELETTNEELQATNEELTTVNDTLEFRSHELTDVNVVLTNIQRAIASALIVVDTTLRLKRFSPQAAKMFDLNDDMLGSPLGSIDGPVEIENLIRMTKGTISGRVSLLEELTGGDKTYLVQTRPYILEDAVNGAVITLDDISALTEAKQEAAAREADLELMSSYLPQVLYKTTLDGSGYTYLSNTMATLLAGEGDEALDQSEALDIDSFLVEPEEKKLERLRLSRAPEVVADFDVIRLDGQRRTLRDRSRLIVSDEGMYRVGVIFDITDLVQARELAKSETVRADRVFTENLTPLLLCDSNGVVLRINSAMASLIDYEFSEIVGQPIDLIVADDSRDTVRAAIAEIVSGNPVSPSRVSLLRHDGRRLTTSLGASILESEVPGHKDSQVMMSIVDLTRLDEISKKAQAEAARFSAIFDGSGTAMFLISQNGIIQRVNSAVSDLLGYTSADLVGQHFSQIVEAEDVQPSIQQFRKLAAGESSGYQIVKRFLAKDGKVLWGKQFSSVANIPNETAGPLIVDSIADLSEERNREQQFMQRAQHDSLTGLLNRNLVQDRLDQAVRVSRRTGEQISVLMIDIDGFKSINDSRGHDVGDKVLCALADSLTEVTRESDSVARLGGDEFLIVTSGSAPHAANTPEALAAKLLAKWNPETVLVDDGEDGLMVSTGDPREAKREPYIPGVSLSIGIASYPLDSASSGNLIKLADVAMYSAKAKGGDAFAAYSVGLSVEDNPQAMRRADLIRAFENNELEWHFQPQINMQTNEMVGMEALVRWAHPKRGLLEPLDFLDLVAGYSLANRLFRLSLAAAREMKMQLPKKYASLPVSVNCPPLILVPGALRAAVEATWGSDVEGLTIELVERSELHNEGLAPDFDWLREKGGRLSVDDFGSGFSNFSLMEKLRVEEVKIDKSLITRPSERRVFEVVSGFASLASALGAIVVAEGIEEPEQRDALLEIGIEIGQGFLLAPPMDKTTFLNWLQNGQRASE